MEEEAEDYRGRKRLFSITCGEGPLGFTVRAHEKNAQGAGYEFAVFSEISPYSALGRLRQKIHRGLATRHISKSPRGCRMLHDTLSGRMASDGTGGLVVVVDGIALSIDDLAEILISHE